jgi:hypothetical protein
MPGESIHTDFMPAEKAEPGEVERQRKLLAGTPGVTDTLNGMLNFSLILNRQRQAVFINKAFSDFLSSHGITEPIGQRFGNLAGCTHPAETAGGCGTTESCLRCGMGLASAQALEGKEAARECRIMSGKAGEDLDLRVSVKPFNCAGEGFLLVSLADISSEKRRQVLERLFFHDVLNTAGGVQGLIGLMAESEPAEAKTYVPMAAEASDRMIAQIFSQRDLSSAERGDLQLKISEVGAAELLEEVAGLFRAHEVGKNKEIAVEARCLDAHISTDKTLLSRVIGNLLKNALEAEAPGAKITLSCEKTPGGAAFSVHNPGRMPDDARLQVFQRSFSTKGAGRGLGTYSIRLLTEKYLKGKVSFATGPGGTTFRAEYPASL